MSFVAISSVLCRCFKVMSLVEIYPNRASSVRVGLVCVMVRYLGFLHRIVSFSFSITVLIYPKNLLFFFSLLIFASALLSFSSLKHTTRHQSGGAGSEVWNRVYMIAPVKKFGRVGLCTNFIPNKHGGGEEGELAELAVIWCTRVCVGSALFPLYQV